MPDSRAVSQPADSHRAESAPPAKTGPSASAAGNTAATPAASPTMPPAVSPATRRIDVPDVVARLRHLDASAEPAMVFSQLSAVFVPAFCDEVSIDLVEDGGHRYRIRRLSSAIGSSVGTPIPTANGSASGTASGTPNGGQQALPDLSAPIGSVPDPELTADSVRVEVRSPEGGVAGPPFAGVVVCAWRQGYLPNAADGALIRLMVDHAVALIQRERLTSRVPDLADDQHARAGTTTRIDGASGFEHDRGMSGAMNGGTDGRIDTAVGIVMSLHHLNQTQAIDLLVRLSHRARRQIREVAGTIVDTGVVPDPGPTATAGSA